MQEYIDADLMQAKECSSTEDTVLGPLRRERKEAVEKKAARERMKYGAEYQVHSPMTINTVGTAAPGVIFDAEAAECDILISSIQISTEEQEAVEYTVYVCEGSWLDQDFAKIQDPKAWTCAMKPKLLVRLSFITATCQYNVFHKC